MWTLGRYGEEERGRKIDVQVDGQCECGLEGDLEKRRAEGRSTCRWMDNVNVDLREIWRRGWEIGVQVDGQCECGLEGDMAKRI